MESKEDSVEAATNQNSSTNIHEKPAPYAPSDLSIVGFQTSSFDTTHQNQIILREKVVIVGDATVGKTSLVQAFLMNEKRKSYLMTSHVDFNVIDVHIPDSNITVDLFLYDMGGQSIFNQRDIANPFWVDCSYIICVFDVSSRKSFLSCRTWIESIRVVERNLNGKDFTIPVILIGNKIDLREGDLGESRCEVETSDGTKFANEHNLKYFECSVENDIGIEEPFQFIAMNAATQYQERNAEVLINDNS